MKPHVPSHSRRTVLQVLAAGACALRNPLQGAPMDPVSARIQADLERHASFGIKRSASPGDLATAAWIAERLRTSGYKVNVMDFEAPFLVERSTRLVSAGMTADLYAQPPCKTTGPKGVTARLALIRTQADAANTKGKIALLVLAPGRYAALGRGNAGIGAIVKAAATAGAAGVVIVTTGPSGEAALLNVPEEPGLPLPVAILAPKISMPFQEAAADGAEATLILDGQMTRRNSQNVIGRIERGNRWIAISTPRSGWFQCVGERGTGTAVFLELAAWAAGRFPNHSIHLMNTGGHEYYFTGSHKAMEAGASAAGNRGVGAHRRVAGGARRGRNGTDAGYRGSAAVGDGHAQFERSHCRELSRHSGTGARDAHTRRGRGAFDVYRSRLCAMLCRAGDPSLVPHH